MYQGARANVAVVDGDLSALEDRLKARLYVVDQTGDLVHMQSLDYAYGSGVVDQCLHLQSKYGKVAIYGVINSTKEWFRYLPGKRRMRHGKNNQSWICAERVPACVRAMQMLYE